MNTGLFYILQELGLISEAVSLLLDLRFSQVTMKSTAFRDVMQCGLVEVQ
jgi:hypothetical protein